MCFFLSSLNLIYASSIPSILPAFSFASNLFQAFFIFLHPSSFPLSLYQNVFLHFSFIPIHSLLSIHKFSILQSSCSNISLSFLHLSLSFHPRWFHIPHSHFYFSLIHLCTPRSIFSLHSPSSLLHPPPPC